jgi:serine/threonine protein kinase
MLNLDLAGQQLGNYRVITLLGRGGYAEVYLGEHIYLETQAAIKVLHARLGDNEEAERFRYEGRTIARLLHPHIVRVFDFDIQDDVPFLVMDYAPNGSLRKRHPKGTRLPLETVLTYVQQIASALQYAHDQHLVHRDVKPENMLLGRNDELLLSDFGTALVVQTTGYQSMQQDDVIGTVAFMAPELFQGKAHPASDQYALGVVVYQWLCGETPFHGTATEIAIQHAMAPVPSLREKVPSLPPLVEEVIVQALAKDVHQRFSSVQDFADALEKASTAQAAIYSESTMSARVRPDTLSEEHEQKLHPQSQPIIAPASFVKPLALETAIADVKPAPLTLDTATAEVVRPPGATPVPPPSPVPQQAAPMPAPGSHLILPAPQSQRSAPPTDAPMMYAYPPERMGRSRKLLIFLLIILVFLFLAIAASVWFAAAHSPTSTSSSLSAGTQQAQAQASYANIEGNYSGSIDNTTSHIITGMALSFQQNQGKISGQFTVNAPLVGSGPLTGTIDSAKHVKFTVQGYHGNAPLLFVGSVQSDGSLTGTYCSLGNNGQCSPSAGGNGTWKVSKGQGNEPSAPVTPVVVKSSTTTSPSSHKDHKHGHGDN